MIVIKKIITISIAVIITNDNNESINDNKIKTISKNESNFDDGNINIDNKSDNWMMTKKYIYHSVNDDMIISLL